ncbi:MAG: SDR family oxidoreductase [Thermonemataceae bacterium]
MKTVLLTGVTGFLGAHTTIQLLEKGYKVVGTLRNKSRSASIRKVIQQHTSHIDHLSFREIDLMASQKEWSRVANRVDHVMHIASPFPVTLPKREEEVIQPAKQGTLRVLQAAIDNGVKKVVLTSSSGAVVYGKQKKGVFNEKDWTDTTNRKDTTPYFRSKTLAEKAAWEFVEATSNPLKLTTILPGAIVGPVLEEDIGNSANIVKKMLDGSLPAFPKIGFEMVDVRDVATLHIKALESPRADGERFLATAGFLSFKDVAALLREHYPQRKIPMRTLPNFLVRLLSNFEKELQPVLLELDAHRTIDSNKARQLLDWQPIPLAKSVIDCAESLFTHSIIK